MMTLVDEMEMRHWHEKELINCKKFKCVYIYIHVYKHVQNANYVNINVQFMS